MADLEALSEGFRTAAFPVSAYCVKPNDIIFDPAAMATFCLPSSVYVIGEVVPIPEASGASLYGAWNTQMVAALSVF
jgi:hypothetical protein